MTDAPPTDRPAPPASRAGAGPAGADTPVVIKKYANRRLYNTQSSSYVTLDHLAEMVKLGTDFIVYDARSNEDITRQVLTQIIFEEESRGENLLPIQFLRQLIRFYGASMQSFVPSYLEMSLDAFTRQHEKVGGQWSKMFNAPPAYPAFEEQVRQNMALFERAMKMFTPFAYGRPDEPAATAPPPAPAPKPEEAASAESFTELKRKLDEMQRQIERLAEKKDDGGGS